jgi:CBS domain-containing protein
MKTKRVKDVMTANPFVISPDSTLCEAAQKMKEIDCGILPVGTIDNVIGMISDRDIVIRGLAQNNNCNDLTVDEIMTNDVFSCDENDDLVDAADTMFENKIGRLIVTGKDKKVSGILSFGGIVRKSQDKDLISEVMTHATSKAA